MRQQGRPCLVFPLFSLLGSVPFFSTFLTTAVETGPIAHAPKMPEVARLIERFAGELDAAEGDVLDLACGSGQNGLFVANRDAEIGSRNRKVVLLDRNIAEAVRRTADLPQAVRELVVHEEIDLETEDNPSPLPEEAYGAVLVFNYLHRPLIPNLRDSVKPGGIVLYKTFTWEHPAVGVRPSNPAFLLGPGELRDKLFVGWEVLDFFEGVVALDERATTDAGVASGGARRAAVSSIVCRKPPAPLADGASFSTRTSLPPEL
ncbi:unnamed protein product [Scytosiphon promiscuus]